jgi:hypothetical protein
VVFESTVENLWRKQKLTRVIMQPIS